MDCTLPYQVFSQLVQTCCRVMESSELGRDAATDPGSAFWLAADGQHLSLKTAIRGLDLSVAVETDECVQHGDLPINPFMLKRMHAAKGSTIRIVGSDGKIDLRAGQFRTSVALVQGAQKTKYDEVLITHTIPAKILSDAVHMVLVAQQSGAPVVRLVWDQQGCRLWAHNSYTAAHTVVLDDPSDQKIDVVVPITLLAAVVGSSTHDVQIGVDRSVFRIRNDIVDLTHPLQLELSLEDIERDIATDRQTVQRITVDPAKLGEGLLSIGSVDRGTAGTAQTGVDLWVIAAKQRLVVCVRNSVGNSTYRIELTETNTDEDIQVRINFKQFADFVNRSRGQQLVVGVLPDRVMLWAGQTTYILSPLQEDEAP